MQTRRYRLDSGISIPSDSSSFCEGCIKQNGQVKTRHASTSTDTGVVSDTAESQSVSQEEFTCKDEKLGREPLYQDGNNNRKVCTKCNNSATLKPCSFQPIQTHFLKCHSHRKSWPYSELSLEDEMSHEKLAKRRKRCKSEHTSEGDPLLQTANYYSPPLHCDNRNTHGTLKTHPSPIAELDSLTRSSSTKCVGDHSSVGGTVEIAHHEQRSDVSEPVILTASQNMGENTVENDDPLVRENTNLHMLDSKVEQPNEKINKWLNVPEDDDEKCDSLKVIVDEQEFDAFIDTDQVKLENVPMFIEKDGRRMSCFGKCQGRYAELHTRIDGMTHDYQRHNKKFDNMSLTLRHFKGFLLKLVAGIVAVVICSLCIIPTTIVVGKVLDRRGQFLEEREWNFTKSITGLKEDFSSVASMVNEIMTRPRSVIQVTSDDFVAQGNMFYLRWKAEEHSGQGNLRLSNSKDSIQFVTGGYYQIFSKLYYSTTLNTTANIKLQYNILQRKSQASQHAIKEFTATRGAMRHELMTQATMYMYPGEEILVSFDRDQQKYIANFQGAHQLGVFELN